MIKKILLGIAVLLLIVVIFVFIRTRPSGDIDDYKNYFASDTGQPDSTSVRVTFLGTSTVLFDDGQTQILIDGFFSRPSLWTVLTKAIESDTARIDEVLHANKMNRVKAIFATHSHYDHAFDVAYTTRKTGATLYGSTSTLNIARGGHVDETQLSLYQPFQNLQLGKFTVQVIPSKHSGGNALKDDGVIIDKPLSQPAKIKAYAEGGSFDFYITHNGHNIFVKPSPNFIEGALDTMKADVVFIGIATITNQDTSWQNKFYAQTIGKLKPRLVIPLHWDDFLKPLSENLVMLPKFAKASSKDFDFFIEKTKADNIDFKILQGTRGILLFKEQN